MKIEVREQIKSLLATRNMTLKELAEILSVKTGKKYTLSSLSARLKRGSFSYNEVITICEILNYDIEFKSTI